MIWDPYERLLWGVAITLSIICGFYYINKARWREDFQEKTILLGFACLIFGYSVTKIITYVIDFSFKGIYLNNTFVSEVDAYQQFTYDFIGFFFITIGLVIFIFTFEIIYRRTKFLLTIINIIGSILILIFSFISPFDPLLSFLLILYFNDYLIYSASLIIYLYTKWSKLEIKAVSAFLALGFVFLHTGTLFSFMYTKKYNEVPLITAPLIYIIGCFLMVIPFFINPENLRKAMKVWILVITIFLGNQVIFILIAFFSGGPIMDIINLITSGIFLIFLAYLYIKNILKTARLKENENISEDKIGVLSIFTKPQKVTEEEVSVAKEKKICLVCKNELSRENYICPNCKTFYCIKCSKTLSDLENACWVCNTPFDEGKPVKPFVSKEEVIDLEVSEKSQKKPKINQKKRKESSF